MNKSIIALIGLMTMSISNSPFKAQELDEFSIEKRYQNLTTNWLAVSEELKYYSGFSQFCLDQEFRNHTIEILKELHHYDSVVLEFLQDPATEVILGTREHHRTLKEIASFEGRYSITNFIDHLRDGCVTRNDLERNKKDLERMSGMESYDGQMIVLETDISRYLKHIDHRILSIDKHMHQIHPDQFRFSPSLSSSQ